MSEYIEPDAPWIEKYKPKTIDDLALDDNLKEMFNGYVANNNIPFMTLSGSAGIGKTSLANILIDELDEATPLYINASENNGIDMIRSELKDFVEKQGFGGLKIVILDEADGLSPNAQGALRQIMQTSLDDTRFILTCNYPQKIIDPIFSRAPLINIPCDKKDIIKRCMFILKSEGIKLTREDVGRVSGIVNKYFPDIRKVVQILERCYISGQYRDVAMRANNGSAHDLILDKILAVKSFKDLNIIREFWMTNEASFEKDYSALASSLYNRIVTTSDDAELLITLSSHIYQLDNAVDQELQFHALTLELL